MLIKTKQQVILFMAGKIRLVNNNDNYVTGFGKTDHIVTIDISRNTDLKY